MENIRFLIDWESYIILAAICFTSPYIKYTLTGVIEQEEGEDSAPLMILEYMQHGDLHGFLADNGYEVNCTM